MVDISKCQITHYPADVLAKPAKPVEKIDEDIHRLVEKMTEIMREKKGVGFAATQAGVPLRLFIISLDGSKENVRVFINPTVTPIIGKGEGSFEEHEEGCLSVPGIYTKIRRYSKCKVTATDLSGKVFTEEADGLYARALQHESDHIDGITIVNRMLPTARISHRKQLKKLREENANGEKS
ncbi:MAG: peptide deformylase [Sedimentisphaerales bacterium]|nr:peptide deformylase [Sedimentisphaerales bacterium]